MNWDVARIEDRAAVGRTRAALPLQLHAHGPSGAARGERPGIAGRAANLNRHETETGPICTLVVANDTEGDHPLVVGANRDEYLARPASAPQPDPAGGFFAPRDLVAGGTWIGVNRAGVFVGLVNRPQPGQDGPVRSRGLVVRDALGRASASEIARDMRELLRERTAGFRMVYGDLKALFLTVHGGDGTRTEGLGAGIHVVCSRDPSDTGSSKAAEVARALEALDWRAPSAQWRAELGAVLGQHRRGGGSLDDVCVHRSDYGTRSCEILARSGQGWRWWHADGAPCRTEFREMDCELADLQPTEAQAMSDVITRTEVTGS